MTTKDHVRRLLRSRGIEVGGYRFTVDTRDQQMFNHFQIKTVLDVGANIGQYAQTVRWAGFTGTIISSGSATSTCGHMPGRNLDPKGRYPMDAAFDRVFGAGPVRSLKENLLPEPITGKSLPFNCACADVVVRRQPAADRSVDACGDG